MKTYRLDVSMTALSSISHSGGQSFGINQKLRREKFVQPDGSVEEIPVLSGNGLRGMLRDRAMLHMCRALGYGVNEERVQGLSLPAFHFLFGGGSLTGDGGKTLNLEEARKLRELIPLVGIFGGAVGNMILPGKLKMGKAIPVCLETSHLLPQNYRSEVGIMESLQEEMYTRKDDEKNENLRMVINPGVRGLLDSARSAKANNAATAVVEQTGQSQQMMYYVETFAAGTRFYWRVVLDDVTDVEFDAFLTALVEFAKNPYVGGKSNIGHGEVSLKCEDWLSVDSRKQVNGEAVGVPAGKPYSGHLKSRGAEIRLLLDAFQ
jgi:CRISPR type IV-associated protein Csf2